MMRQPLTLSDVKGLRLLRDKAVVFDLIFFDRYILTVILIVSQRKRKPVSCLFPIYNLEVLEQIKEE